MNKYLIIRFSSFGDIVQALPSARLIRDNDPSAEIHWLTRQDFHDFFKLYPVVNHTWSLKRTDGFSGLLKLTQQLNAENFTHIYDAHNNLRSFFVATALRLRLRPIHFLRRTKSRIKRFLLFKFRINLFPKPFRGINSFLSPLNSWFTQKKSFTIIQLQTDNIRLEPELEKSLPSTILLAPSATWELKRWPADYWSELVGLLPQYKFALLGGEKDTFCNKIAAAYPQNIINLSGRYSWVQSTKIVALAKAIVSGDTGILHVADLLGRPTIALIGPTAFGYPSHKNSHVLEVQLNCKPCTKDGNSKCHNSEYKKCLKDIRPELVAQTLKKVAPC